MKFVKQEITGWISSNIGQDYLDYNPATSYIFEDIGLASNNSVCTYKGYYWRSLSDDNIGNNPEGTEGVYWNKWKVANINAMLDQKSLSKTETTYTSADADYLSSDTATNIATNSLVWDVNTNKMFKALAANDLPETDFTNSSLWENVSDIIVTFKRKGLMNAIGLGYLESSKVVIEHLDADGRVMNDDIKIMNINNYNLGVYDVYTYGYAPYNMQLNRALYFPIIPIGTAIRVTIERNPATHSAKCGFLICGNTVDMGKTLDKVNFKFNSYSSSNTDQFGNLNIIRRNVQDLVDFETIVDKSFTMKSRRQIKENYDNIVMFVVDENENSKFENMITLGKIDTASVIGEVLSKNVISWSIFESI